MLPRYGPKGANSRYRLWQYVPLLRDQGIEVDVRPMLGDNYIAHLYARRRRPLLTTLAGYFHGVTRAFPARNYDVVVLDQELVPYVPAGIERILARMNPCLIVDYDDAAYCKYSHFPLLDRKIETIMSFSRAIVVGNHHLAEHAQRFAADVRLIPTVVDVSKYKPKPDCRAGNAIRICWIGTPITANRFLMPMLPLFRELQQEIPSLRFRFIGAGRLEDSNLFNLEQVSWSEETEASSIAECDIGIMPLLDNDFERGKCGLKLLQYMAASLPVVASPVGENRYIVDQGGNGFLAADPGQWRESLRCLIVNSTLRERMGRQGRSKVERQYSLSYGFDLWQQLLRDVRQRPSHRVSELLFEHKN